jgi:hypothetical protein
MKWPPVLSLVLFLASTAGPARADARSWGGESGRFQVSVLRLGFDDGAGGDGWEEASARDFAGWALRFNSVIPRDASVSLERGFDDDDASLLTLRRGGRADLVRMPGGPDFEAALAIVARHFGVRVPRPPTTAKLYSIQLLASASEAGAASFATGLETRGVAAEGSFFHDGCLPCSVPEVHVRGPGADGVYRVVTGIFDRYSAARRAVGELRRRFGIEGFVREL